MSVREGVCVSVYLIGCITIQVFTSLAHGIKTLRDEEVRKEEEEIRY